MTTPEIIQAVFTGLATVVAAFASFYAARMYRTRILFEKQAKNIQDQQKQILQQMSEFGTQLMTHTLKIAPQFAFSPYTQLLPPISPSDISLFDRRRSHFTPEKEKLAEKIVEDVRTQIDKEAGGDEQLTIILILDAGSTVFPIFRQLCVHPAFQFNRANARRLKIITNNLPGVSQLIKYGRIGDPIRARTLFECRILVGFAHSQYEASLSSQTSNDLQNAVEEFRQEIQESGADNKIKVVSVTTGNYVSTTHGILARDPNHVMTKGAMLDVSDDVYVLAPLGKLLPYSCDEINELLGYSGGKVRYATLANWPEKAKELIMVVTTRDPDYFRQLEPSTVGIHLGRVQAEIRDRFDEKHLITIPFDPKSDVRVRTQASIMGIERALCEYEFPHENLRESLIRRLRSEHE
jgi:DeoR/GlpR family transcriptional regulator of sugar metabolism